MEFVGNVLVSESDSRPAAPENAALHERSLRAAADGHLRTITTQLSVATVDAESTKGTTEGKIVLFPLVQNFHEYFYNCSDVL